MKNQTPLFLQGGHLKPKKTNNMPLENKQEPPYYTIDTVLPPDPTSIGYEYIATLSQTTTTAPTADVAIDTITGLTIARAGAGQYTISKTGAMTLANLTFGFTNTAEPNTEGTIKFVWTDVNTLTLWTYNTGGTPADDILVNTPIYIRKTT